MAGKSSNLLVASSSASTKKAKQEEKRKQSATRAENAKKPRPFQLINFTAPLRGSGTAVSGVHCGASNAATATTAALALPAVSSAATGIVPPLVLVQAAGAGAAGQLVSLPLQFVGYHPTCRASGMLPAPAVGIPLAAALDKIESGALGRMLSALMPTCKPPLWPQQSKTAPPPPWWPTGSEDWWQHELLDHLGYSVAAPVPFASSYSLKKAQKVAVLVAIVKHLAPEFDRMANAVRCSGKLSGSENKLWDSALNNKRAKFTRQVFVLLPSTPRQQQDGGAGGSAGTDPEAGTGSVVVVHSGNAAASDGCGELQVANHPAAGASLSVSVAPADGSRGEVIAAAAESVVEKEQRSDSDGVGVGVVAATDAPAGDDGRDQPVNGQAATAGGGDGSPDKQGAAVAAAAPTTGHVCQVAGGPPEMTTRGGARK